MHPLRERACDELLENPLLRTPPPEPERPKPPKVRKPRVFILPPRFPLLDKEFYASWCNHRKELQLSKHKVDDSPPELFPELYLKPKRLDLFAQQYEANMESNKELLKRINIIQRTGGFVDCWIKPPLNDVHTKLLCSQRQRNLDSLRKRNLYFYSRLLIARSEQPLTSELNALWEDTKSKLILGASIMLDIWVRGGSKIGKVIAELFMDIVPDTCALFLSLIKGDDRGHAYSGTRFFRIVPGLYCRGGDVSTDNGFGTYLPKSEVEPKSPEGFPLNHTVPGVMSMVVSTDNEVYGQFNIIFKPLPRFDKKHVVFGRIITGPAQALERISAMGHPLGTTSADVIIKNCGWFTKAGHYREGSPNTIKFPKRRKN